MYYLPAPPRDQRSSWPATGRWGCRCSMSRTCRETSSPYFPGERLIACRNPFEAAKRARTREKLLAAT